MAKRVHAFSNINSCPHSKKSENDTKSRKNSTEIHLWAKGPPIDAICQKSFSLPAGTSTGVVQQRISSFLNMTKERPSALPIRKTSRGGMSPTCSNSDHLTEINEPLFKTDRTPTPANEPLSLKTLTEAAWNIITIPTDHLLNSLDKLLLSGDVEWRKVRKKLGIVADSMSTWDDWHVDDMIKTLVRQLDTSLDSFMASLGNEYARECYKYYGKAMLSFGSDLEGFLLNLTEICDILINNQSQMLKTRNDVPTLHCNHQKNDFMLHFYTNRDVIRYFITGFIITIGIKLFDSKVTVRSDSFRDALRDNSLSNSRQHRYYFKYTIHNGSGVCHNGTDSGINLNDIDVNGQIDINGTKSENGALSTIASDSKISNLNLCNAFPWHFICDTDMRCTQMGSGLYQVFGSNPVSDRINVIDCFTVVLPEKVELNYKCISARLSTPFVLAFKCLRNTRVSVQDMQLKGQMFKCPESSSIMFVGSPLLDGMDQLKQHGLYLSDIPIHDATRDVILVGEQARAQDGLKRRMAQLKDSILKTNKAVDNEREKNVSLLHLIFPPKIAKRLWSGETIEAETHQEVSVLFSDIVGFTSICSTATPLMIVDMLQILYTKFDNLCGYFDIYKVETIGDAYCVAGNLHRRSKHHAQRVTWMGLIMIDTCTIHTTHSGEPIRMRIGVHTGPVLAGVVGTTMPRYCLFGSNVNLANSFESTSEPLKVNISPTTHRLLLQTEGFTYTKRKREDLPKAFPKNIDGVPYFVESFRHPCIDGVFSLSEHVDRAIYDMQLDSA